MNSVKIYRTVLFVVFMTVMAMAGDSTVVYQKGTLARNFSSTHKSYDLRGEGKSYQINNCADFQDGQAVEYRVVDQAVYIRHEGSKDYKCKIEATLERNPNPEQAPIIQKGLIQGYESRFRISRSGVGGARRTNVYELRGTDLIYEIDFCGAFQAGEFTPGQVLEYRVDTAEKRLYVRRENGKEYSCQIEGTIKPETANSADANAQPAAAAAPSSLTARLSVSSAPDGADIEVDGTFSGNTPSDLQIPEGEHVITVKKSGYKDWQRKMKVVAGSNIRLNAAMETAALQ